ncbi:MAG: PqqD family protein [Endomicrobiales bacterium]
MEYIKTDHLAWRMIEGQAFVVDTRTSTLHEFDEVGSFIWKKLDRPAAPEEIARELAGTYEVSLREAQADVNEFLETLETKKLVEKRK